MLPFDVLTVALPYVVFGIAIHRFVDWLLQNHWQAQNKMDLRHPAAWIHSGLHTAFLLLVFPPAYALVIGVIHLFIDTRVPLNWWRKTIRQTQLDTTASPAAQAVAVDVMMWGDQVLHETVIVLAAFVLVTQ